MFIKGRKVGSKCNKCMSQVIWGGKGSYELCYIVLSFCLCLMERLSSSTVEFTSIVILTFKMIQSILWCHQWCNSIWRNAPLKRKQGRRWKRRQFVFCYESCLDHGRPLERDCSSPPWKSSRSGIHIIDREVSIQPLWPWNYAWSLLSNSWETTTRECLPSRLDGNKEGKRPIFIVLLPRKLCGCFHEVTKSWAQHEKKSLIILHMDNHKLAFLGILQLYCWYMCLNIRDGEDSWQYCGQPRKETEESLNKLISLEAQITRLKLSLL